MVRVAQNGICYGAERVAWLNDVGIQCGFLRVLSRNLRVFFLLSFHDNYCCVNFLALKIVAVNARPRLGG